MREKILSAFSNLEFIEEGHKYFIHNDDGTIDEPISVSSLIKEFEEEVDWEAKAEGVARKEGVDVSVIKRRWKENSLKATNSGTMHHEFGESYMNFMLGKTDFCNSCKKQFEEGFLIPCAPKQEAIAKYWEDLYGIKEIYPLLPEVKMYMPKNNKFGIKKLYCGTADITLAMKYKGEWSVIIHDYKGLPLDTPIATKDGWSTMGELKEGDEVFDKNGKLTKILHTSEIHYKPCKKIIFDDKSEIIADEDHRWEVSFNVNNTIENKVMTTKELQVYLSSKDIIGANGKRQSHKIPKIYNVSPLQLEDKDLPIHPYVFGLWLGDGNKADGKITNMYDEIWDEIKKCGYELGNDVSQNGSGKAQTRNIIGLTHELRKLNCLCNKHIPDIFLRSSYKQRLELLQGIMDADGYYNPVRNRYVLTTTKEYQVDFSVKILSTLGIKPTVIPKIAVCTNSSQGRKKIQAWDVCFTTDIYPFKVRKIDVKQPTNNRYKFRNIVKVVDVETVPTRCIEVDSNTHTYCFGYNMIVTHNTNKVLTNDYARKFNKVMLPPFDNMIDESTAHYAIQLSAYSLMLMNLGFKVIDRKLIWLKNDGEYEKIQLPDITQKIINVYQ